MYPEHLPTICWAYASAVSSFPHNGFVGFQAFFFPPREENSNKLQRSCRQWCQKGMNYLWKHECTRKPPSIRTCKHASIPRTRSAVAFLLTEHPTTVLTSWSPREAEIGHQHPRGWRPAEHRAPSLLTTTNWELSASEDSQGMEIFLEI